MNSIALLVLLLPVLCSFCAGIPAGHMEGQDPHFSPQCPPLPCPLPPEDCVHVPTFYWLKQQSGDMVLCPGCDQCANHPWE